jgi:predicted phage baseplate assembly protein
MALASIALDDLTWSGMVDAARRRIVGVSNGAWTLHSPVDPGVTLLELLAWLLEQRMFWLDQVPDSLLRGVLTLLDEAPRPSRGAVTVLALADDTGAHPYGVAPKGVALELDGQLPPIVFTTDDDIALLPVMSVGLVAFGRDRSADLAHGRVLRLLPANDSAAEAQVLLTLASAPAAPVAGPMSLLLELDASSTVRPAWSYDAAAGVAPPATLTWWYRSPSGLAQLANVDDGTGGLRRSGVVRLPVPSDWTAEPGAPNRYAITIRTDRATFSSSPRVKQIAANAVIARHRRHVTSDQRANWLPLPGNTIELARDGQPPLEATVTVTLDERVAGPQPWTPVADLSFSGPTDRVFVVDRGAGVLRFGDGLTGRVPVLAQPADPKHANAHIGYDAGGGAAGNLGGGFTWRALAAPFAITAANVVDAIEGAEPEALVDARSRAAASIHAVDRAVTAPDYKTLATTTPGAGVGRAHAAPGAHPLHPCPVPGAVTVFVVPDVPADVDGDPWNESAATPDPVADPGMLAAVRRRLDAARMVGTEVFVASAPYARPAITIDVVGDAASPADVANRVTARIRAYLDPLNGGDDGAGWPFGGPLRPSALIRQAQTAAGSDGRVTSVSIDLDGTVENCADVSIGANRLVAPAAVHVRWSNATAIDRGGLR